MEEVKYFPVELEKHNLSLSRPKKLLSAGCLSMWSLTLSLDLSRSSDFEAHLLCITSV